MAASQIGVGGSCPISVCQREEVHSRESALKFGQALLLRKLNHGDVKLASNESDQARAGCENIDDHGADARNCWRGAWKSNPNLV
jgi:hypothetical protein